MALSDILEAIRSESNETISSLLGDARHEADRILAGARSEAEAEERHIAGSRDGETRVERARVLSLSHLDAARERRLARERVYQEALDAVARRLEGVRGSSRYEDLLGSLLDEALASLPGARTIRVDSDDVEPIRRAAAARDLDVDIEVEDTPMGGVVVLAPGRTVDNRIATRLRRADAHLRFVAGEIIPELRGGPG